MNKQSMVAEFMLTSGRQHVPKEPEIPDLDSRLLRIKLIAEELSELAKASMIHCSITIGGDFFAYHHTYAPHGMDQEPDMLPDAADALADLLYIIYGTCVAWGIKIDPVFGAVHAANMEKLGPGARTRKDGKVLKPPDWKPPDIKAVLESQGWLSKVVGAQLD